VTTALISTLSYTEKVALMKVIEEKARRSLIAFTKYTKPDYKMGWFNKRLAHEMDHFLDDVVHERSPRLIIEAPPRHGKSELVSRRFPAYALGRYPDLSFIGTSYASDLASQMNRDVQRVIDSPEYGVLFPDTRLWGSNIRTVADGSYLRNSDVFEIVGHAGVYKSAGVGAGITGRGGRVLLIDDPVKDAAEAHSETVRKGIWEWFSTTLYTRCEPGGGIAVIMTRWHLDDLVGKLRENMKKGGEQWRIVRFPAIAEEDEFDEDGTLYRHAGECLHRARFDEAALKRIEVGTADEVGVGSRTWAALYQQRPAAAEGNIFKRENWQFIKPPRDLELMSHSERAAYFLQLGIRYVVQGWDTALGGKKKNDFTACTTLGVARNRYYIIDVWRGRLQFPDVLKQVELQFDKWRPTRVVVEGGGSASGKATVQLLTRQTRIPFKEVPTVMDKVFRADQISPTQEAKLITIIQGGQWPSGFVDQCANFPSIKIDDDVDSWMIAMEDAMKSSKREITDELLDRIG
jgi:predicted phage terminase large subunit-like protein